MFRFGSSGMDKVERERETGGRAVVQVEGRRNCVILGGAQGSKCLCLVCMARLFYCQNQCSWYRVSLSSGTETAGTLKSTGFIVQICA
jgi:hypothetical protein